MDSLTLSVSPEASNKLTAVMNAISDLVDVFVMSFDKVSAYWIKSVQGVFGGVKSLFVDVILIGLKKIECLVAEMKKSWSDMGFSPEYIQSLISLQKSQLDIKLARHTFFRENFEWKVNQVFA